MIPIVVGLMAAVSTFAQSPGETALALNSHGNETSEKGDYVGAARDYREAIQIWRSLGPEFDAHLAGTLMNLGTVLCGVGHRVEGAAAYEESLALHRRTLGERHLRTLSNMNLLATDYLMIGELDKAEALLNQALPIARADFPQDIQLGRSLEALASVQVRHGKMKEAVASADEALAVAIRVAGEHSIETGLAYASAGEMHRSAHEPERALPLYRKAHAIYLDLLGERHPRLGSLMSQEGLILLMDGKLSMADDLMTRAVQILQQGCPDCLVERAIAENNLGLLRLQQKRYREADEILTDAVEIREKFNGTPTPDLGRSLQSLAVARKMLHRDAEAATLAARANSILGFR